jgi:uncharacterized protein (DUF885 family)
LIVAAEVHSRMITKGLARPFAFLLALLTTSTLFAQTKGALLASAGPAKALHALFDSEWEYTMRENPTYASVLGDKRYNDRWEDASLANVEKQHQHALDVQKKLAAINRGKLSKTDQINYDMFKRDNDNALNDYQFKTYLLPLNQRDGIQTLDGFTHNLTFNTTKDFEDWIARLNAFPTLMDQTIALMREGIAQKVMHPKVIMQRVPAQIDKQLVAPEESGYYKPFKEMPNSLPAAEQQRLRAAAKEAVANKVIPAYKKLKEFFVSEYLPASYDQVGAWQRPNGDKAYAFYVREYTTTDLTPDQIHELGLKEVARIKAEMEQIKEKTGFKGSMSEFFNFLRSDPQFFYKTPDELLTSYRARAKRIDPMLVKLFKTLPRLPYGVEPIPDIEAPDTTTAYYSQGSADGTRAGTYFVNLYKPDTRPKWEMMALSLHESVPGHHLQISRGMELGEIPKFRRYGYLSAFGEGWGLYAESLGDEMGLYNDPYDKFGQLTYDMWRAVRLVVDTGMHAKKWTRQQAIDYFMQNAAKTEQDVVNEVDRYIAWPGQALSYKMGQLKIRELRTKATQELGPKFDVREFHDVVIGQGAVPLDALEEIVDAWIAEKQKSASPSKATKK